MKWKGAREGNEEISKEVGRGLNGWLERRVGRVDREKQKKPSSHHFGKS